MNVFEVIFTPQAEEQLEGIAHHIAVDLCNRIAAEEFVDNIIEQWAFQMLRNKDGILRAG